RKEMRDTWEKLNNAEGDRVDLVTFGCPHCTIAEVAEIARLLGDKRVHPDVKLYVGAPDQVISLARRMGYAEAIEKAGGFLLEDCGGPSNPFLFFGKNINTVATDSTKAAAYVPRVSQAKVFYGETRDCIDAAITGKWRGEPK
ncbi:MAG: aconitase X, partial [Dehalococcoidia bacterium]